MRSILVSVSFAVLCPVALSVAGCGGGSDGEESFDNLQDCFDDHTMDEGLPVQQAIVVCCTDHPIAGKHPSCGTTAAECNTIVRAGLSAGTTMADITAACTDYQNQLGM